MIGIGSPIFSSRTFFNAPSSGNDTPTTGVAADFTGAVGDLAGAGGVFTRISEELTFNGGTNGARGNDITSTAANGAGSTQFCGIDITNLAGGAGFTGLGSVDMFLVRGHLGVSNPATSYGEMGGVVSQVTNDRIGGLAEAAEFALWNNQQAKASVLALVMIDNAGVAALPAYDWARGLRIVSAGSQQSGDALYVDGTAGWTNFQRCLDNAGNVKFRVDNTGKVSAGVSDTNVFFMMGAGSPAGVVVASPGALYLRTDGGAGTTLYVKETGVASSAGWVAK